MGFESAPQTYIASQKATTLPTELSVRPQLKKNLLKKANVSKMNMYLCGTCLYVYDLCTTKAGRRD